MASSALAWAADRYFFAPPGMSSSSSWCSWEIIRVWSSPRDRRAVGQDPQHRELLVIGDRAQPGMRVAASATECASVASVLRPCPVANTRVRADSLGGTSTTCSPSASSRLRDVPADALAALDRPGPLRPPPAPPPASPGTRRRRCRYRPPPSDGLIAGHDLDRGRALVRVHPDDYLAHPSSSCPILLWLPSKEGTATSSRTNPS